jgi:hypothetical protein
MRFLLKLMIVLAIIGGVHHWWVGRGGLEGMTADTTAKGGSAFIEVWPPDDFPSHSVVIMTPENCPSDAAQRAESLYAQLEQAGVPVEKRSSFELSAPGDSGEDVHAKFDATMKVANGAVPVVFIGSEGASNPNFNDVLAEYRRQVHRKS